MSDQKNPWSSMWTHPRNTVRHLMQLSPKRGLFLISFLFCLQDLLYGAYFWSLGLSFSPFLLFFSAVGIAAMEALPWLYVVGWLFFIVGKWLKGNAKASEVRIALSWSKLPMTGLLFLWAILLMSHPDRVFILDLNSPSSLFIFLINAILGIWSLVLLIQSIREVQGFSLARAIGNVLISSVFASVLWFLLFSVCRYFYLNLL